jgi:protein-L-isoaspartate O-methyltransferase
VDWETRATRLADEAAGPVSRWHRPVASVPRHQLVPRWWERDGRGGWLLRDGAADPEAWLERAYSDSSVVTRVGPLHADHATADDRPAGLPTSSATMPGLCVLMLRHARLVEGADLLDVGTGAGGLAAYAARRLGDRHVTTVDVDAYLMTSARERLDRMGLRPQFFAMDATRAIPGSYDRVVSTVAIEPGAPLATLLGALRTGGRLVTTLARTSLILTAWKGADGDAVGRIEHEAAAFMATRQTTDYPPPPTALLQSARDTEGDEIGTGRYPVLDLGNAWEVRSLLEIRAPGTEPAFVQEGRRRTAYLVHPDGSWARATAEWSDPPLVHQGGPQRLWTVLESIRNRLNMDGGPALYGTPVRVAADGVCHLSRGDWRATMG